MIHELDETHDPSRTSWVEGADGHRDFPVQNLPYSGLERLTATPRGVALCPLEMLAEPGARNFVLQIGQARFHGFVVRKGGTVHGYVDRCPHMGLPLAKTLDDYLTPSGELIACGWHGALFRPDDGRCVGGPCVGESLLAWPVEVSNGVIKTA